MYLQTTTTTTAITTSQFVYVQVACDFGTCASTLTTTSTTMVTTDEQFGSTSTVQPACVSEIEQVLIDLPGNKEAKIVHNFDLWLLHSVPNISSNQIFSYIEVSVCLVAEMCVSSMQCVIIIMKEANCQPQHTPLTHRNILKQTPLRLYTCNNTTVYMNSHNS